MTEENINLELCHLCEYWVRAPGGWPNIDGKGNMCSERVLVIPSCLTSSTLSHFRPKLDTPLWKVDRLPLGKLMLSTVLSRNPDLVIIDGIFKSKERLTINEIEG